MRPLKRRGFGGRAGQSGGATWCGQLYSPPDFLEAGKYCAAGLYRSVSDTRLCLDNARVFPYNSFAVGCCVADRGVGMAGVAGCGLGMWLAANRSFLWGWRRATQAGHQPGHQLLYSGGG